jgi:hypothetical protein
MNIFSLTKHAWLMYKNMERFTVCFAELMNVTTVRKLLKDEQPLKERVAKQGLIAYHYNKG